MTTKAKIETKEAEKTTQEIDKKELEILRIKARILDLISQQQQFNNQVNAETAALNQKLAELTK